MMVNYQTGERQVNRDREGEKRDNNIGLKWSFVTNYEKN